MNVVLKQRVHTTTWIRSINKVLGDYAVGWPKGWPRGGKCSLDASYKAKMSPRLLACL